MAKKITDNFAQFMKMSVTMSAANTITFGEIALGVAAFQYLGLVIHRIEYVFGETGVSAMSTTGDFVQAAICGDDSLSTLALDSPSVYDIITQQRLDLSAAAANNAPLIWTRPIIHDFTGLPEGGLLVPAKNIYIGMDSAGLAVAGDVSARVYYTIRELKAEDYIDLAQRLQILST